MDVKMGLILREKYKLRAFENTVLKRIWDLGDRQTERGRGTGAGIAQSVLRRATGWTAGVRFPAGAKAFSLLHSVQTGSVAHPASYPMGSMGLFPRGQSGRGVKLTTHLHLVPRSIMVQL
jgi:hypothetical protein